MQPEKNVHLSVPPDLLAEMEAAAKAENKTLDEWAADAFARVLASRKLRDLAAYGHENARSLGINEGDVPRLIKELREEHKR